MDVTSGKAITGFMNKLLDEYAHIRGKPRDSYPKPFWDIVVITTVDEAQQEAFQLQVNEKVERQELPPDLPVHVISDPPGTRIGNGGSTLVALEELEKLYGQELFTKKVLLVHAGGWSQRMPSASILGKVFSLLPHGLPPYQMLDLKLALYWPLVERMQPGVFLVCADDFVLYSLSDVGDWRIPGQGFTALAHPAPIEVGTTHGVYVMPDTDKLDTSKEVIVSPCSKVLQKNSAERLEAQGAVLEGEDHHFADGIHIKGKAVYTDSSFYFGTDVMKKLISFKKSAGELSCEIDAYGDFLPAVGEKATNEYINFTGNIRHKTGKLLESRQAIFDCLNGTDIHILVLNASLFVHIGTTKELLYHYCEDVDFQKKMAFQTEVFNTWSQHSDNEKKDNSNHFNRDETKVSSKACIIHSAFHSDSKVCENNVIDYCDFEAPVHIRPRCILSNCQLKKSEMTSTESSMLEIPTGAFLHTVSIQLDKEPQFVTVFFHIEDNLKKLASVECIEDLPFWGSSVGTFMKMQGLSVKDILPKDSSNQNGKDGKSNGVKEKPNTSSSLSLWDLRLYPAQPSMTASLEDALRALHREEFVLKSSALFSLADLLMHKNVRAMLSFRKQLHEKIKQHL